MTAYSVMPDLEAVCGRVLREAGIAGGRVYSSLPRSPSWPLLVVERLGGVPVEPRRLDAGRIQVSAWGTSKSDSFDAAELARRTLHETSGSTVQGAFICGVLDELGLTWLPDPATARDRYLFTVVVYAHI